MNTIGKFIRSKKTVNVYHKPGELPWRVAKPETYIGKVAYLNSKGNWLITTDDNWISFSKDLYFVTANEIPPLTQDQKIELAMGAMKLVPGSNGQIIESAYDVTKGTGELGENLLKFISFLSKHLTIIVVGVGIVIALPYIRKIKLK